MNRSPAIAGLRLIFRRPAIALAEIIWRWSFAAAVWFLAVAFAVEYLDSLPVNAVSRFLLGTGQPILIARALKRIFEGSALRFTETGVLLGIGLGAGWIVLASLGRAATVDAVAKELGIDSSPRRWVFPSLASIHFLRMSAALAAASCNAVRLARCASVGFTPRSISSLGQSVAPGCAALQLPLLGRSSRRAGC